MGQQQEFAARLARINRGGLNTNNTLFVGLDQSYLMHKAPKALTRKAQPQARGDGFAPLTLIFALLLGVISQGGARWIRYQITGGADSGLSADMDMAVNFGIGMAVALVLMFAFRLRSFDQSVATATGVAAMVCLFHNLVHWYPEEMALAFSPKWVNQQLAVTEPNSAEFRGIFYNI